MSKRALWTILVLGVALLLAVVLRLMLGPDGPEWPRSGWSGEWGLRTRRIISCATVGAALAVGGVMLQSLLRNPLASPDLIGPAAGAGLAVTLSVYLATAAGISTHAAASATGLSWAGIAEGPAALIGASAALGIVYLLSQRRGFVDPVSLILVGVIVSIICSAGTLFIAHLMPPSARFEVSRWMIGAISDETPEWLLALGSALALAGIALTAWLGPAMDVAALSEDEARASGVAVGGLRLTLFIASGILTAVAVVLAGPVGFIGLVAPHIVRLIAGPSHRALAIGAALAGALLVILADSAVRALDFDTGRIPLGVVTALVGGPIFLILLRRELGAMRHGAQS